MPVWSEAEFLEAAGKVGGSRFARAHSTFLAALRHAGAPPIFDGTGKKVATYSVRVTPDAHWHILRVYANGYVILMLNHLRDYVAPSTAALAEKHFDRHLRSKTRNSPYLAHAPDEFMGMDFDDVARAVREVADAARATVVAEPAILR